MTSSTLMSQAKLERYHTSCGLLQGPAERGPPKVMHACIKNLNLRCTAIFLALQDWRNDWMDEKEALFRSMAGASNSMKPSKLLPETITDLF